MAHPSIFFLLSPFVTIHVIGTSMEPTFQRDTQLLVRKKWFLIQLKKNDVIVFSHPDLKKFLVKRISDIKKGAYFVLGDNKNSSTDSRDFGWIEEKNIIGKVVRKL